MQCACVSLHFSFRILQNTFANGKGVLNWKGTQSKIKLAVKEGNFCFNRKHDLLNYSLNEAVGTVVSLSTKNMLLNSYS